VSTFHAMSGHGGHRSLLMVMVGYGYKFEGKCWALLPYELMNVKMQTLVYYK
jgi:hypothetical protein